MSERAGVLSSTAIAALIEQRRRVRGRAHRRGADPAREPRSPARAQGIPRARELPAGPREREREDRAPRHARDRPCARRRAGAGLRLHRAADGTPRARARRRRPRQPQELHRPARHLHPPHRRRGARVRPGAGRLPGAALRRGLAPHLQHRGARRQPAQPDPLQAGRSRAIPKARWSACMPSGSWSRARSRAGASPAACRSPSILPATAAASSAGRRSATPT